MASQPRTHDDYTVGWVCALPKEQTAAVAMLDERHPKLPKPPNDDHSYTLGSMGDHNIVITCLPIGKIGTVSAATVAAHMVHTFPFIKFGLMVGIGGGIPPQVRLGDVVVGIPMGQYPGVIHWDLGKEEKGGKFTRTGSLDNPPRSVLGALSELLTEHELGESKIQSYLDTMASKYPPLASKYLRSGSLQDMLFRAFYEHNEATSDPVDSNSPEEDEVESCRYCDKSQVVRREPRDMQVHYGVIASGNRVIKNATFRDNLRRDLGKDVLCVEMEAAGMMENFPCIVVRGICDYADSHKNKAWQEHAAAVAAAFAKELLGYVEQSGLNREKTVKDALDHISGTLFAIDENVTHTRRHLEKKGDLEILDWLTATDYGPQQTDYLRKRQPGTGQWLLDSREYQDWIQESNKTLFCPGIPGAGKTILTSIVINDLETRFRSDASTTVAYVYCNYNLQSEQTVDNLLSGLLKQLCQCRSPLPSSLTELYYRHMPKRTRPSFDEISEALQSIPTYDSRIFIAIDALDECQDSDGCRTRFLTAIFDLQIKARVNIFATSRLVPEITERFKENPSIEIRATECDIRKYLQGHVSELPKIVISQPDIQEEIITSITNAADGMFLLAQLHFASLKGKDTRKRIQRALRGLVTGSNAYDAAYSSAMARIQGQLPEQAERAKQILSWITCVRRPLTKLEAQHALAVEVNDTELDKDNIPQIEDVVSVCAGLVIIDEGSSIIRLVHYTAHDYFQRTQEDWFPNAQSSIATTCITYLSFHAFANGCTETDEAFEERLESHPFYSYAACNWAYHSCEVSDSENIVSFLQKAAQVEAANQVLMTSEIFMPEGYSQFGPNQVTGLHLAAYFGLAEVAATLFTDYKADTKDSGGRTPLSYAAQRGHEAIVKLLLSIKGVDPNSEDHFGRTPLSWAVEEGHEGIVKLLLATEGVDPNLKDNWDWTPLSYAAESGREAIVKLLLAKKGVDPNSRDRFGRTPLLWAATHGHEAIVNLLMEAGSHAGYEPIGSGSHLF